MSFRNSLFIAICILSSLELAVLGDDLHGPGSRSEFDKSALLLRSGRTIEGQILETETHYIVQRSGAKVPVPKSEVEFIGESVEALYHYKLHAINDGNAEDHVRLAEWCMLINLYDKAIEQLEIALRIAPSYSRAQAMLDAANRAARLAEKSSTPQQAVTRVSDNDLNGRIQAAFQQDVSASLISNFSVQVQPMLTRTCAMAGCHDSSHTGPLVLTRSPRPVAKLTQQNLRSVLVHIDRDDPDTSAILAYAVRPHGKLTSSPIPKGASDPAFVTLAEWVRAVSGKSPNKAVEHDQTRNESSIAAKTPAVAPKQPAPEPGGNPLERENSQPRLKLEDLPGGGRAYSNKPIAPTASRIRAGMIAPNAPAPQVTAPPAPAEPQTVTASRSSIPNPLSNADSNKTHDFRSTNTSQTAPASPSSTAGAPQAPAVPTRYQPVDPFDPEIFNRQFAPRPK